MDEGNAAEGRYRPGERVRLKSGGPVMTIVSVAGAFLGRGGGVSCSWVEEGVVRFEVFRQHLLEIVE